MQALQLVYTSEWLKDIDKKEGMNSNDFWNVKQQNQDSDESGTRRIREYHVTGKMFAVVCTCGA